MIFFRKIFIVISIVMLISGVVIAAEKDYEEVYIFFKESSFVMVLYNI